jgi:hypothetical protein
VLLFDNNGIRHASRHHIHSVIKSDVTRFFYFKQCVRKKVELVTTRLQFCALRYVTGCLLHKPGANWRPLVAMLHEEVRLSAFTLITRRVSNSYTTDVASRVIAVSSYVHLWFATKRVLRSSGGERLSQELARSRGGGGVWGGVEHFGNWVHS